MGLWEKKRCRGFYIYIQDVDFNDPKTWKDIDITKAPMRDVFKKHKLEDNTIDFLGHAVALYKDDAYLNAPAIECLKKVQLYMESLGKYGDSPFLYLFMDSEVYQNLSVDSVLFMEEPTC